MQNPETPHGSENRLVTRLEDFARLHMQDGDIAHDYQHAQRVRNHALRLARMEGYPHLDRVQAAALLHDIALKHVTTRKDHGARGAEMAAQFLSEHQLFAEDEIAEISHAIRWHDSIHKHESQLLAILRDADMLELFGAIGLQRAIATRARAPVHDPAHFPAESWGLGADEFSQRFAAGAGIGPTVIDQISFHISCYENLNTPSARLLARPLVEYMLEFMQQLVAEISADSQPPAA